MIGKPSITSDDSCLKSFGISSIHFPPVKINIAPLMTPSIPNVIIMAGTRNFATPIPFMKPIIEPSKIAASIDKNALYSFVNIIPQTAALIPIIEPTDTSIFFVNKTKDWPIAKTTKITLDFITKDNELN